jgi:hypothetical protein
MILEGKVAYQDAQQPKLDALQRHQVKDRLSEEQPV